MSGDDLPFDVDLLIKCMKMTTTDNPNQALVALNKANAILARNGFDWEAVLRSTIKITTIADPFNNMTIPSQRPRNDYGRPEVPTRPAAKPAEPIWNPPPPRGYSRPTPPPPPPKPAASPPQQHKPAPSQPNRFAGTCILCGNIVGVGEGFAVHNGVKWHTEHKVGLCPSRKPRRRQPTTTDDLMI